MRRRGRPPSGPSCTLIRFRSFIPGSKNGSSTNGCCWTGFLAARLEGQNEEHRPARVPKDDVDPLLAEGVDENVATCRRHGVSPARAPRARRRPPSARDALTGLGRPASRFESACAAPLPGAGDQRGAWFIEARRRDTGTVPEPLRLPCGAATNRRNPANSARLATRFADSNYLSRLPGRLCLEP